jgi:hypothetical protein
MTIKSIVLNQTQVCRSASHAAGHVLNRVKLLVVVTVYTARWQTRNKTNYMA